MMHMIPVSYPSCAFCTVEWSRKVGAILNGTRVLLFAGKKSVRTSTIAVEQEISHGDIL